MATRELRVNVIADTSGFTSGMRKVQAALGFAVRGIRAFARAGVNMARSVGRIVAKITSLSAAIAGGGFTFLTIQAFRTTGALSRMSRQLGVTVADLARAKQAAILSGQGAREFDGTLRRLSSQLQNAGDKAAIFKVKIQEWVAETAKGGTEANRFGLAVSDSFALMVERANVAAVRLRQAFVGRFRQIAVAIAPFVEFAANKLTEFVTAGTEGLFNADSILAGLRAGLGFAVDLLQRAHEGWVRFKVLALDALIATLEGANALGKALGQISHLIAGQGGPSADFALNEGLHTGFAKQLGLDPIGGRDPGAVIKALNKGLKEAVSQQLALSDQPRWRDQWLDNFDDFVDDARNKINEFKEIAAAPKLSDIKLPKISQGGQLAPSVQAGSALAARTSFASENQGRVTMTQKLTELLGVAKKDKTSGDNREGLLATLVRQGELIQVVGI